MTTPIITALDTGVELHPGIYTKVLSIPPEAVSATVNLRIASFNLNADIHIRVANCPDTFINGTDAPDAADWITPVDLVLGPNGVKAGIIHDTAIVLAPGRCLVAYSDMGNAAAHIHGFLKNGTASMVGSTAGISAEINTLSAAVDSRLNDFRLQLNSTGNDVNGILASDVVQTNDINVLKSQVQGLLNALSILNNRVAGNGDNTDINSLRDGTKLGATYQIGYKEVPQIIKAENYTLVDTDSGKHIFHPTVDTSARIYTIPDNATVPYKIGTVLTFINGKGAGALSIAIGGTDKLIKASDGTEGPVSLAAIGMCSATKVTATSWMVAGVGLG